MTADKIRDRIDEICTLFGFDYNGKSGAVDPFNHACYKMWYGDADMEAHSIDEVMQTPFFDGKSLQEIATKIKITDW